MFARIAFLEISNNDCWFYYYVPKSYHFLRPWYVIEAPVKSKLYTGIVLEITKHPPSPEYDYKEIQYVYESNPILLPSHCSIIDFVAQHYFLYIHQVAQLFLPRNIVKKIQNKTFTGNPWHTPENPPYVPPIPPLSFTKEQEETFSHIFYQTQPVFLHTRTKHTRYQLYEYCIKETLKQQKQCLIIVPEILKIEEISTAFSPHIRSYIFPIHSDSKEKQKKYIWNLCTQHASIIVIGTRMALFLPFYNLGCILLEEPESDYYGVFLWALRYDAIEVALYIAQQYHAQIVLWTRVPKIVHLYEAIYEKRYVFFSL